MIKKILAGIILAPFVIVLVAAFGPFLIPMFALDWAVKTLTGHSMFSSKGGIGGC